MLKEVQWGGKHPINSVVDWQSHETYPTGHNISEVDWGALHVTEVWHMAQFWVSYGRYTLHGSPICGGQKDCLDIEQVRCFQQETPRKMHHCMLLGCLW